MTDLEKLVEGLFAINFPADDVTFGILKKLQQGAQALSAAAEEGTPKPTHKAATEFTLDEAVEAFGLTYSLDWSEFEKHLWDVEALPDVKTFQPSACIVSLLHNYTRIYDRSSQAGCRIAVDLLLCECIGVMRSKDSPTKDGPTPYDVKVYCEVSFTHEIDPMSKNFKDIVVSGRVDHGVGIVIKSKKLLFRSLLVCVETKCYANLTSAFPQLVVYLACLRQSRINKGRSDTSVYGVVTDGFAYVFFTITHEGVLKWSNKFDLMQRDLSIVLGCLKHILEIGMSQAMTPTSMPEKGKSETSDGLEADGDDPIDLDDTPYCSPMTKNEVCATN